MYSTINNITYNKYHSLQYSKYINRYSYKNIHYSKIYCKSSSKEITYTTVKWFGWSILYNIYNKEAVLYIDSSLVTAAQILISTGISTLYINNSSTNVTYLSQIIDKKKYIVYFILVSIGQWYGNYFGNLATSIMTISSVNIIKSSEPIISMIIMYIFFKTPQKLQKVCLIFPIIIGIMLCNTNNLSYSHYGTMLCILSNIFHTIKVIALKKYFSDILEYKGQQLIILSTVGSFLISLPILLNNITILCSLSKQTVIYLVVSSIGYHYNSIAAFNIITKISPVTFSLLNIYKRIVIILSSYIYNLEIPTLLITSGILLSNISLYFYLK